MLRSRVESFACGVAVAAIMGVAIAALAVVGVFDLAATDAIGGFVVTALIFGGLAALGNLAEG